MIVTRFAPSPTGMLHLGHAYAALFAERAARGGSHPAALSSESGAVEGAGRFLLRIEDIDRSRARRDFEAGIFEDLAWLGLAWEQPVRRQSEHMDDYRAALARLEADGLVYPCFCTRRTVAAEIAGAGAAPHGTGAVYPGTCRTLSASERAERIGADKPYALRFDSREAHRRAGPLAFTDDARGTTAVDPGVLGDAVIARKDVPASYQLAVVVDDAAQGVTLVTRGEDLLDATHVQRLLQAALRLPEPRYHHHRLLLNDAGERLSKRDGALNLKALRDAGVTPADIRTQLGFG
jgi:glutamyl-Q tRNA(Asp) synthetase